MTTIDLPEPVAHALHAVAAVDDTDPSSLAGMVLADWLASHRDRFTRAAEALANLAGDQGRTVHLQLHVDTSAFDTAIARAREATQGIDRHHLDEMTTAAIAIGDEKPEPDPRDEPANDIPADDTPERHPCDEPGCAYVGHSLPALNGHRGAKHRRKRAPAPVTDERPVCPDCDETFDTPQGLGAHRRHRKCPAATSTENADVAPATDGEPEDDQGEDDDQPTRCAHCHGIRMGDHHVDSEPACTGCWRDAGRPR